jgi:hypothetical protein
VVLSKFSVFRLKIYFCTTSKIASLVEKRTKIIAKGRNTGDNVQKQPENTKTNSNF